MFKLYNAIIMVFLKFIALIFAGFITIIKEAINFITGKSLNNIKNTNYHIEPKKTFKKKNKTYEYDKNNNIWRLTEEEKRIAKEEKMTPAEYIEAEERDDDNLDFDE